jgi:large subunit ribosomal protein L17
LIIGILMTESDDVEGISNAAKNPGRIITTLPKAKEVRPLLERCVTIARKALKHLRAAKELEVVADRGTQEWKRWRESERWQEWNHAMAPALAARRRLLQIIGNEAAVRILVDIVAPRFEDRNGGYTRILRLFERRLGDAGQRAILEFVGQNNRTKNRTKRVKVE